MCWLTEDEVRTLALVLARQVETERRRVAPVLRLIPRDPAPCPKQTDDGRCEIAAYGTPR